MSSRKIACPRRGTFKKSWLSWGQAFVRDLSRCSTQIGIFRCDGNSTSMSCREFYGTSRWVPAKHSVLTFLQLFMTMLAGMTMTLWCHRVIPAKAGIFQKIPAFMDDATILLLSMIFQLIC